MSVDLSDPRWPSDQRGLLDKRCILVLGKGGVGRTTVSAALARALARHGRRTLLYQANAKEKLSQLLGRPPIGPDITPVGERLDAVNTNPGAALHEYGVMVLRYETVYKMVFENKIAKALLRAIPGLDDFSILGKLWYHTTEEDRGRPRWDTVVFDAPATGHAVTMLNIPNAILDAVPEGPLTKNAVAVRELLADPARTAVVLVTLAEEMPANETLELAAKVRALGLSVTHLVVNQVYPDLFGDGTAGARALAALGPAPTDAILAPLVARATTARTRRRMNELHLGRLRAALALPEVQLPVLFTPSFGPAEVTTLSEILDRGLDLGAGAPRRAAW